MKKSIFFGISISLFLLSLFFIPKTVHAIGGNCQNPNLYSALINVDPIHGLVGSSTIVEMKFKWNPGTPNECKNTNLRFDLSYSTSTGEDDSIAEYPFGKAGTTDYIIRSRSLDVLASLDLNNGDTITLSMTVEDDDPLAWGYSNVFSTPKVAIFTVRTAETNNYACAIEGYYKCSPGNKSDCSDITSPPCGQSTCNLIKKEKCDQPIPNVCGDGMVEATEQCDGSNLNGKSCFSLGQGFTGGILKCNTQCGFDTSQCIGGGTVNNNCGAPPLPACPTGETVEIPFQVPNPLQGDAKTVAELVGLIVKWLFSIAIPIAVAVIVYSGILFLTSKGNPAQVMKAKQFLTYAVIGLAIILVGSGFITLIRSILELSG